MNNLRSKLQYVWEFRLDGKDRKIELQHSRITGKRRIYFDGKEILKAQKYTYEFSYSFSIDNHYLNLTQLGPTNYDLRIDNMAFNSITNEIKKQSRLEKRKQEGKEIVKSILDDDFNVNLNKNKEEYVDFDNKKSKNIVSQIKNENDDDFFKIQNRDNSKNEFDEGGFEFEDNKVNHNNKIKNEDIFGLGFC